MKQAAYSIEQVLMISVAGVFAALLVTSCAQQEKNDSTQPKTAVSSASCKTSNDQSKGYMAALPGGILIEAKIDSQFSVDQQASIQRALQYWNESGTQIRSQPFFSMSNVVRTASDSPTANQDCDFDSEGQESFRIVKMTGDTTWSALGMTKYNPAVTIRCYSGGSLTKQIVMVNESHTDPRQMQSIVLHELGHTLGLDHSCDKGAGSSEYKACSNLPAEHSYRVAVMFPTLRASADETPPETKENLTKNDSDRTACLYGP